MSAKSTAKYPKEVVRVNRTSICAEEHFFSYCEITIIWLQYLYPIIISVLDLVYKPPNKFINYTGCIIV